MSENTQLAKVEDWGVEEIESSAPRAYLFHLPVCAIAVMVLPLVVVFCLVDGDLHEIMSILKMRWLALGRRVKHDWQTALPPRPSQDEEELRLEIGLTLEDRFDALEARLKGEEEQEAAEELRLELGLTTQDRDEAVLLKFQELERRLQSDALIEPEATPALPPATDEANNDIHELMSTRLRKQESQAADEPRQGLEQGAADIVRFPPVSFPG